MGFSGKFSFDTKSSFYFKKGKLVVFVRGSTGSIGFSFGSLEASRNIYYDIISRLPFYLLLAIIYSTEITPGGRFLR